MEIKTVSPHNLLKGSHDSNRLNSMNEHSNLGHYFSPSLRKLNIEMHQEMFVFYGLRLLFVNNLSHLISFL